MSKAFVKDGAADDLDELESADAAAQPASGAPNYVTRAGYERLKAELLHLIDFERPEVVRVVSWAASNGDRSENGDYIYGKRRLRAIDRRVRYLTRRLDEVKVVREAPADHGKVYFGAWITLEDEDGKALRYRIVGPDEFDVAKGLISMDSPVARAVLGKRLDDEIRVHTPAGEREYVVTAIEYP